LQKVGRLAALVKCHAQLSFSNFIIATALANTALDKFYGVDLPALEDVRHEFYSVGWNTNFSSRNYVSYSTSAIIQ